MGRRAQQARQVTRRMIRGDTLSEPEKVRLRGEARYEGSPYHKRNPGDFGLTPPSQPRPDKTLCDEAGIKNRSEAESLFAQAIERGLVSRSESAAKFPKQIWVVDESGRVFEAMHGGTREGRYHGYPIRRSDPLFGDVSKAWNKK